MKRRRVKITGIGPVTPAGIGREAFWEGILAGRSYVRPFTNLGDEYGPLVAAGVEKFSIARFFEREQLLKGAGRHAQFATVGAKLALEDAGLAGADLSQDCVVVTGSSLMDFGGISNSTQAVFTRGPQAALPRTIFTTTNANVTESIAKALEMQGRTMTLQNSCCAGLDAVGYAAEMIARSEAEIAVCGGTEAPLHRCPLLELRAAGLTPPTTERADQLARPFDLWRTTGVVSEGACMFILEPESSPRPGYAFVGGYSYCNDKPGDLCGGLIDAARLAFAAAGMKPQEVEALHAWGPGHRMIDAGEAMAMRRLLGDRLDELPALSIKGAVGSALGAAPAIQLGVTALGLRNQTIPPTVNWSRPDPSCPLNLSNVTRFVEHESVLLNSHGVGNVNSCMVLQRC